MNRTKRYILSLILVIALLAIPTFVVFAKELGMLTISGPGIKGELTLNDPKAMMRLEQSGFFNQTAFVKPPENLGEGYRITAHLNLDGKMVPWVEMVYYPTQEGQPGYVHYTGRFNGETLQTVDQWHILLVTPDKAFRSLMAANKITLQSALSTAPAAVEPVMPAVKSAVAASASPAPITTPYIILVTAATILLLVGAGLVLRRRAMGNPTT